MQAAQKLYDSIVSNLSTVEQLELVQLILAGVIEIEKAKETISQPVSARSSVREIMAASPEDNLFKTPEEVEPYQPEERDSLER